MNKEDIKKQFEILALGCLEKEQYQQIIKTISEDEELKTEYGKYQKVASLIPFSLKLQQPPADIKNKVVIGIKKIILSKMKETKPVIDQPSEQESEIVENENIPEQIEQPIQIEETEPTDILPNAAKETVSLTTEDIVEDLNLSDLTEEKEEHIETPHQIIEPPEVKVNIDYGPALKEEIVEEVTKKIKKTISYQFEEFENKISKKNRLINVLLIIITLLTLLLVAFNFYQFFYSSEKKADIKKEYQNPPLNAPDTLL